MHGCEVDGRSMEEGVGRGEMGVNGEGSRGGRRRGGEEEISYIISHVRAPGVGIPTGSDVKTVGRR